MPIQSNIINHSRDDAFLIPLAPGSIFGETDLQSALGQLDVSALYPIPELPAATLTDQGIVRKATVPEVNAREDTTLGITPLNLNTSFTTDTATVNRISFIRHTNENEISNTISFKAVSTNTLWYYANTVHSTDTQYGTFEFADSVEAINDTLHSANYIMRPKQTVEAIIFHATTIRATATIDLKGATKLLSKSKLRKGASSGIITPYYFDYLDASATQKGGFKVYDPSAFTGNYGSTKAYTDYAITAGTYESAIPDENKHGFVQLTNNLSSTDTTRALTALQGKSLQDNKVGKSGGTVGGTGLELNDLYSEVRYLTRRRGFFRWKYYWATRFDKSINDGKVKTLYGIEGRPINSLFMTTSGSDPSTVFGGRWTKIQGRCLVGVGSITDDNGFRKYFHPRIRDGETTVKLVEVNLPEHKHASWGEHYEKKRKTCVRYSYSSYGNRRQGCLEWGYENIWPWGQATAYGRRNIGSGRTDYDNHFFYSEPVGGSKSHNNMMPYEVVNIWKRIG